MRNSFQSETYTRRRGEIAQYFDRTAAHAWRQLTSNEPLGRIRSTVRAGRDDMRNGLLDWLPGQLDGARILDAGCGTGALAVELVRRGADVVAVDLSPTLIALARERLPVGLDETRLRFESGDMLADALGSFDWVVAMDSLIHYESPDMLAALVRLAPRVRRGVLFTFAPWSPALAVMHGAGRLFPRGDRAPDINPVRPGQLAAGIARDLEPHGWRLDAMRRVKSGFYTSQAVRLLRA
jgi:magnesium-protoporphyrin O-methyltransferase